jgi:hypothetical protein
MSDSDSSEKRKCEGCGEEREVTDFAWDGMRMRDGERYRACRCNFCKREYDRQMRHLRQTAGPPSPNCELCHRPGRMQLDHDHATGKFRGWLCGSCNCGLGKLGDDIAGLRRAIAYLLAYLERSASNPKGRVVTREQPTSSDSESSDVCRRCGEKREMTDFRVCSMGARGVWHAKTCRACTAIKQNGSCTISARRSGHHRPAARSATASGGCS